MSLEHGETPLHQFVIVGDISRSEAKRLNAGAVRDPQPNLGNEHPFEVEAKQLHESGSLR